MTLVDLAKKLRKNEIAVDMVSLSGDFEDAQIAKLQKFIENVNKSENSHFIHIKTDSIASDMIISSQIMPVQQA